MVKYLIIQLCDSSPSFCHYQNSEEKKLISIENLERGIIWAMKHNVSVQILYPKYKIPNDYKTEINRIEHIAIVGNDCEDKDLLSTANSIIFNKFSELRPYTFQSNISYILRTKFEDFLNNFELLGQILKNIYRLNVVFTDIKELSDLQVNKYRVALEVLSDSIKNEYLKGHCVQFNLLTDRFMLDNMNNCNAGIESITLSTDGYFYACPAFYFDKEGYALCKSKMNIGDLKNGLAIKNPQLYKLDHAPICRICDAYQCKRCIWLNRNMTNEINTPSHEQCVLSHIERNASRLLLYRIQEKGTYLPNKVIKEIDYLDPFDIIIN